MKFFFLILTLSINLIWLQSNETSTHLSLIKESEHKFIEQIREKYGLKYLGSGGGLEPKVCALVIDLEYCNQHILSKNELRKLLVDLTELYLQEINRNSELLPYLEVYPFTPNDVWIGVSLYSAKRKMNLFPDYTAASSCYGRLRFLSNDEFTPIGTHKVVEEETYEEAIRKINEG